MLQRCFVERSRGFPHGQRLLYCYPIKSRLIRKMVVYRGAIYARLACNLLQGDGTITAASE
jgi:hypothetical protein